MVLMMCMHFILRVRAARHQIRHPVILFGSAPQGAQNFDQVLKTKVFAPGLQLESDVSSFFLMRRDEGSCVPMLNADVRSEMRACCCKVGWAQFMHALTGWCVMYCCRTCGFCSVFGRQGTL